MSRLARELLDMLGPGRRLVAVDGVDGSGKTTFATALVQHMAGQRPTMLVHLDDYLNVAVVRHARGRGSADGFWLDSYDYDAFTEHVLRPLGAAGDGVFTAVIFDVRSDARVTAAPVTTPADTITVVEGMFLHRDELAGAWDASVFLDVPFAVTAARMAVRDGSPTDPEHPSMHRYVGGQHLYFAAAKPWERATFVVDNTDVAHPRRVAPNASRRTRRSPRACSTDAATVQPTTTRDGSVGSPRRPRHVRSASTTSEAVSSGRSRLGR